MKKRNMTLWPLFVLGALSFTPSCGGGDSDSGDGDGDGDMGGERGGDGDAAGDGDGDGDGDATGDGDGDGDAPGDGDGDMGGAGGAPSACAEECADDGDPCTEDVCNEDTGECGVPRSGNACDDGVFCNGTDTCDEGECVAHAGDPCESDGLTCDEGANGCQCDTNDDCEPPYVQGECAYANECAIGSITVVTTTCDNINGTNVCVGHPSAESAAELCPPQIADGDPCTDDANACNGEEVCQNGSCSPKTGTEPVCGGDTPVCRDGTTKETPFTCVECTQSGHCGGAEQCCRNACIPASEVCKIVVTTRLDTLLTRSL